MTYIDIKWDWNSEGFTEILTSSGVKTVTEEETNGIRDRASANVGEGSKGYQAYVYRGDYGGGRWLGIVRTTDYASKVAESEHKALSKAVR